MDIGLGIYPNQPPADLIESGKLADRLGFSTLWTTDSHLLWREVYTLFGALAVSTRNIRLATAVTNPLTRHPTVTASAVATLTELTGGRAILGISIGDSALRTMNLRIATLATLADTVARCRALLAGEAVSFADGATARLHYGGHPVPIYIAATGPKMLKLAGQIADGVILMNGVAPDLISAALAILRDGERSAGRPAGTVRVVAWAACHPNLDAVKYNVARAILRNIPGASDARTQAVAAAVKSAYSYEQHGSAEAEFARLVPDDLVARYAFTGSPDEIAAQVDALAAIGVDEVALAVPFAPGIMPRDDVIRQLAPALLRRS